MGYTGGKLARMAEVGIEPMRGAARRTTQRVGELLHERTVENTPVAKPPPGVDLGEWIKARRGRHPGTLKESWKVGEVVVVEGADRYSIDVYTHDRIAPYVEYPVLPHLITPRQAGGILRFWDRLGHTVYATIVHHPGSPGKYMLATAIAEVAVAWQEIGAEEMRRWASETQSLI